MSSSSPSAPPARAFLRRLGVLTTALAVGAGVALAGAAPAQAGDAGRYLVTVDSRAVSQEVVAALGVSDLVTYEGGTAGFTATLTARQQALLEADPRVVALAPADVLVEGQAQTLPSHVVTAEADKAPVRAGEGVTNYSGPAVAVIDSGVNPNADYNLKEQVNCFGSGTASDSNGHGTAVSGYMAAYDDGIGTVGVAPGAPIYSIRVLDANNKGTAENIVCALDWVSKNAASRNIKVVNMSLAAVGADDSNCGRTNNDVMHQMVCEVVGKGVTIVSSAGNASTPKSLAGAVPAAYDEVLTATNMANYDGKPGSLAAVPCANVTTKDDTVAINSNYATAADQAHTIAAPGMCPFTTKLGGGYAYVQSGTSMSAAAVSGVVLDCLSSGGSCVGKAPAQVRSQVIAQAKAATERGRSFQGDPTRPTAGKYFGYAISTIPVGSVPAPSPTATPKPTATATPSPTATPKPTATATATPRPTATATTAPVDTVKPTVRITSPASGTTVTGTIRLVAAASDDVGVTAVAFYASGTKLGNGVKQADGSWTLSASSSAYPNGSYSVTAKAQDKAGNVTTSAAITLRVAN
ncbi:S8 family serine peptidase [Rathayibacter sp. ZW T2_19]|uniref:S8 family serine peptidase n=1 Tax=Rathayibacter rubneri TaxID=2950106 RepID=A0A9X2E1F8_9MICO|nr:S8 family serine peptidase [Rathayibacter rubneri]MCM6762706.1 S8 family serine peptidase [Rathayibacter rubneri]